MKKIGVIRTDFPDKFGIPRQSGIVSELKGRIYFEPEYSAAEAFRGLEGYSHIWILWEFSANGPIGEGTLTVRPPRLGGRQRMGVFATRSPFRPNPIGLSCVKLDEIEMTGHGVVLHVSGADLMDNTPIYDIKPYLPYVDSHPEAVGGFSDRFVDYALKVDFSNTLLEQIPPDKREAVVKVLENDPRPSYQNDPKRVYGMSFAGYNIKFNVENDVLKVIEVKKELLT